MADGMLFGDRNRDPSSAGVDMVRGLNVSQRDAVTHEGGPLIVLAGPGTGKTRVITHRIGHLVDSRAADPSGIVAVTFTTKAAEQLRERLAGLVGPAVARRVNAHTIHGFGLRVLRKYADLLDLPPIGGDGGGGSRTAGTNGRLRRCDLIDSAQMRRMLRRLILDEDLFGHARAGGVESIIEEATKIFDYFDNHAMTPTDVAAFGERWKAGLEEGLGSDGTVLDESSHAAGAAAQARFAQFARLHELFDHERRSAGLLTYGDLLMLPIRLLREHPDAAARCRAEFRHWLVDEFQDVNAAQIELLRLLAPPAGSPDVCVVGDDDQSIYGFRGADDQAFRRFAAIWSGARVVELSENYRSRPRIIAVANAIIARAESRFAPDKRIERPAGSPVDPPGSVECVQLREEKEDGEVIAAMIRTDVLRRAETGAAGASDEPDDRGVYERFAVVARSHLDLDRIEEALWLEGVPTLRWGGSSAADEDGVKDVLAWMKLIVGPRQPWHARRLLMRPPVGVPLERVNAWDQHYRAAVSRWKAAQEGEGYGEDPGPFPGWLRERTRAESGDPDSGDTTGPLVEKFCNWFDEFAGAASQESAAALVVRIVRETGVVHADLPDDKRRAQRVESIVAMLNFVQSRQGRLPAPGGVRDFLEYYDDLNSTEQGFGGSTDVQSADDGAGSEPEGAAGIDAVRLMTAHASKGLEFDTVFVPRINPPHGYPKSRSGDALDIPAGLVDEVDKTGDIVPDAKDRQLWEERRLFYVACTRAERRLVLLSKKNKGKSTSLNFSEEILGDEGLRPSIEVVGAGDVLARASRELGRAGGADPLRGKRVGEAAEAGAGVRDRRRELFERARRDTRLAAAGALARVDAPGTSGADIDEAKSVLQEAADRMAAIAAVEAGGKAPEWVDRMTPTARKMVAELAAAGGESVAAKKDGPRRSAWATRVPRPPLRLSYTAINDYLRCPRCYYVKHVLEMQGQEGEPAVLGIALHRALERFYNLFREADAAGAAPPGLAELTALSRAEFFAQSPLDHEVSESELDRLMAQVRLGFERLHRSDIHVLETERVVEFDYRSAAGTAQSPEGGTHRMIAKIDRIDQVTLADGTSGFRIVDYKTGHPSKALLEPGPKDLQLGLYAMALRHEYGENLIGTAEYWLFSTGERGVLELSAVDEAGVRKQIDKVVAGILAGDFEKGPKCEGQICDFLGPAGRGAAGGGEA